MKLTNCPHCGGNVRVESIGWKCEKCRGFIDMQGNFHEYVEKPFMPPMTNADRIRAMTDEELAEFLWGDGCPGSKRECDGDCVKCFLEWLKQPAEVE